VLLYLLDILLNFGSKTQVEGLGATFIDTCSSTSSQVLLYQVFVLQQQELGSAIIIKHGHLINRRN